MTVGTQLNRIPSSRIAARRRTPETVLDWWAEILDPSASIPPVASLLGRHPAAEALTRNLLEDLSVPRLVKIANVAHNRCRLSYIPDHLCEETRAEMAWDLLHAGMRDMVMRDNTAWTDTIELLSDRAANSVTPEEAITELSTTTIHRVLAVCERLINRPYRAATAARRARAPHWPTMPRTGVVGIGCRNGFALPKW